MHGRVADRISFGPPAVAALLVLACAACHPPAVPDPSPDGGVAPAGPRFVSADPSGGIAGAYELDEGMPPDNGGTDPRVAQLGPLQVQLDNGLLATLTRFRGLQLIDVSEPSAPRVVGTLPVTGHQAALFARGSRLFALSNHNAPDTDAMQSPHVDTAPRATLAVIDVADAEAPIVVERQDLPGTILASNFLASVERATLYLARVDDGAGLPATRSSLASFDLTTGSPAPVAELDLPGVATAARLDAPTALVALGGASPRVVLVDASDSTGLLVERGSVGLAGAVYDASAMDVFHDVLRVVSRASSSTLEPVHSIQTFDAADRDAPAPLDRLDFAPGQDLKTFLFLGNKAFAVTYWVEDYVDPFHTFELADDGTIAQREEHLEDGWNRRLVPVLGGDRLVGVGLSDEFDGTPSVSLYDATDLSNPSPLLGRVEVEGPRGISEATWDAGASTVLDGAVSLPAPSGEATETGLVLLPFQAYDGVNQRYLAGTQLFTFSASTLTRRGLLPHGTPVRRSFPVAGGLLATLSDGGLSLFDAANPDQPFRRGGVNLAENHVDWLPLPGGASARIVDPNDYWHWWWGEHSPMPPGRIEVLAPGADLNNAAPLATLEYPAEAVVFATGSTLVAVDGRRQPDAASDDIESHLAIFDLSDPSTPVLARTLTSERLPLTRAPPPEAWGCDACVRVPYAPSPDVHAIPGALVFASRPMTIEPIGEAESCRYWPGAEMECDEQGSDPLCHRFLGELHCVQPVDADEETCRGTIQRCEGRGLDTGSWPCTEVDASAVELHRDCYQGARSRQYRRLTLEVLDVRDPGNAALVGPIDLPHEAVAGTVIAEGTTLWAAVALIEDVPDDKRAWLSWLAVPIDLADPSAPVLGEPINLPGELLAVAGERAITRDWHYGNARIDGAVNLSLLDRAQGTATLTRSHRFTGADVASVIQDGAGLLLVDHDATGLSDPSKPRITVLDDVLEVVASFGLERRAALRMGVAGRVLEKVGYQMVVLNLDDPTTPYAQAAFPIRDWAPSARMVGDELVIPGGRYGIYRLHRDFENLPYAAPAP